MKRNQSREKLRTALRRGNGADPVGPVGPVGPVSPVSRVGQGGPVGRGGPIGPGDKRASARPASPADPGGITLRPRRTVAAQSRRKTGARATGEHHRQPAAAPLRRGEVALIGAGPGDPGLLTQAAVALLGQCDAVAYDALIAPDILALLPPRAARFDVGKRGPGAPPADARSTPQATILALLTRLARAGKRVVRLKGGDPFIFGRGGEEVDGLRRAGVKFRCVPGLTAGLSALSALGIAITDRRYAGSVTLVSAHRAQSDQSAQSGGRRANRARAEAGGGGGAIAPADFDFWAACIRHGTLVVYMGVARLTQIARALGRRLPARTPALVIQAATRPEQTVVRGTLASIVARAAAAQIASPAVVVFGSAVRRFSAPSPSRRPAHRPSR
ncbi:MAG: uroporphyrinogen-III C-methyltransferase [Planctomycetota bacterium]